MHRLERGVAGAQWMTSSGASQGEFIAAQISSISLFIGAEHHSLRLFGRPTDRQHQSELVPGAPLPEQQRANHVAQPAPAARQNNGPVTLASRASTSSTGGPAELFSLKIYGAIKSTLGRLEQAKVVADDYDDDRPGGRSRSIWPDWIRHFVVSRPRRPLRVGQASALGWEIAAEECEK